MPTPTKLTDDAREWAKGKLAKPDAVRADVCKGVQQRCNCGPEAARRYVRAIMSGQPGTPSRAPATRTASVKAATRTLSDFRRQYDQTWKIRDGVKRLLVGDTYMTDSEFREAVGGHPQRWRAAADSMEFEASQFKHGDKLYWAGEDTILEMKRIVGAVI